MSTRTDRAPLPEHVDVVVVGAGLSGVGAGYRLQTQTPDLDYVVLEAREVMGGTWDLFRYPGVRSDSDMFTLGYEFRPWREPEAIADGPSILRYIQETAAEHGVDERIRYGAKVVAADFSTAEARWHLTVLRDGDEQALTCDFLYSCAGYYDYEQTYAPDFPGIEAFGGTVVHPQFWPEDLDHEGKRVVVIGSGATAVTLVPSMASGEGAAEHVTMLQRSPTWISAVPSRDAQADWLREHLPASLAHRLARGKNIAFTTAFYQFCQRFPRQARALLLKMTTQHLGGDEELVAEHFTPTYDPWDQRLCAVPGGDLFAAIRRGDAEVVTDTIETFVPGGIRLTSGRVLPADVVVTATGLQLLAFGGITLHVDGEEVPLSEQMVWQGSMMTGVPNFALCIGYTNASWTLRADLSHRLVTKVLGWMGEHDHAAVVPQPDRPLTERPLLDLASGYVQRSIDAFPRQGDRAPWRVRQNYVVDSLSTMRTRIDRTLAPTPRSAVRQARADADAARAGRRGQVA